MTLCKFHWVVVVKIFLFLKVNTFNTISADLFVTVTSTMAENDI